MAQSGKASSFIPIVEGDKVPRPSVLPKASRPATESVSFDQKLKMRKLDVLSKVGKEGMLFIDYCFSYY